MGVKDIWSKGALAEELDALSLDMAGVSDKIGQSDDTGGTNTSGSAFAKLNAISDNVDSVQSGVDGINDNVIVLRNSVSDILRNQSIGGNVLTAYDLLAVKNITSNSSVVEGDICSYPVIMFGAGKKVDSTLHGCAIPLYMETESNFDYNLTGVTTTVNVDFVATIKVYINRCLLTSVVSKQTTGIQVGKGSTTISLIKNIYLPVNTPMNGFRINMQITSTQPSKITFTRCEAELYSYYAYPFII